MSELKLLPCPFCGSAPELLKDTGAVMCQNKDCQVIVGAPAGSGDPVGSWNRRATVPAKSDRESEGIVHALRVIYANHPICQNAATEIERLRAVVGGALK